MTIIVNGFLGHLLITNGYGAVAQAPLQLRFTNPDAATLVGLSVANPASFCTDPDAARLITP